MPAWDCVIKPLNARTVHYSPRRDGLPIPYWDVLGLWSEDHGFRSFFISLLADSNFTGYRWETPPITTATANRYFEFVLLDEPDLDRPPDRRAFAGQFSAVSREERVVVFANLGNDAVLVVPCPCAADESYGHIAAFVRKAPDSQKHELWQAVGMAMKARVGKKPLWLSTAGMGILWLHVRLDSRPKYYGFDDYRDGRF